MPIDPAQLLKRLEPAVRPCGASQRSADPNRPIDEQDFDALLTLVARGDLSSGRVVRSAFESDEPLTDAQLERLASAADQAEAAGADRAVMILDGRALVMDVPQRVIETELSAQAGARSGTSGSATVFSEVDAAVYVPGEDEPFPAGVPPMPGCGLVPGSVARQLERALLLGDPAARPSHESPRR